jgi:guanylate kinase
MMGPLIIVSGPSGVGKSTIIQRLLADAPGPLRLSVSATTRPPRTGERDGVDYHFWSRERFAAEVAAGAFLEHAVVHGDDYGTLRAEVEPHRRAGVGVLLDIDVQGAEQVRQIVPDNVSVFLRAPSLEEYERRLRKRGTEEETVIQRRLAAARAELALAPTYSYQIVNEDLARAIAELRTIVADQFARARDDG